MKKQTVLCSITIKSHSVSPDEIHQTELYGQSPTLDFSVSCDSIEPRICTTRVV